MTRKAADARFRNSRVSAFHRAKPERVTRSSPPYVWVVVVTTGAIADHHRFDTHFDAATFALAVDPDFPIPPEGDEL